MYTNLPVDPHKSVSNLIMQLLCSGNRVVIQSYSGMMPYVAFAYLVCDCAYSTIDSHVLQLACVWCGPFDSSHTSADMLSAFLLPSVCAWSGPFDASHASADMLLAFFCPQDVCDLVHSMQIMSLLTCGWPFSALSLCVIWSIWYKSCLCWHVLDHFLPSDCMFNASDASADLLLTFFCPQFVCDLVCSMQVMALLICSCPFSALSLYVI